MQLGGPDMGRSYSAQTRWPERRRTRNRLLVGGSLRHGYPGVGRHAFVAQPVGSKQIAAYLSQRSFRARCGCLGVDSSPANVTPNSAPHRDGREAAHFGQLLSEPARGRER